MAEPPAGLWPFLVASGHSVGQCVVLAPRFLADRKRESQLTYAVSNGEPVGRGLRRWDEQDEFGRYTVLYRRVKADPALVGLPGDELTDENSRVLHLAEGVVVTGGGAVDDAALAQAHAVAAKAYREFWWAAAPRALRARSEPLVLGESPIPIDTSPRVVERDRTRIRPARPRKPQPSSPPPKPQWALWVVLIVVVTVVVVAVLLAAS